LFIADRVIGDFGGGDTLLGVLDGDIAGGMMAALLYASTMLLISTLPLLALNELKGAPLLVADWGLWEGVGVGGTSGRYIPFEIRSLIGRTAPVEGAAV
jgi:hypothetical protein